MNLYCGRIKDLEWCCYLFADDRGKAKSLFYKWCPDEVVFTDILINTIKKNVPGEQEVCDEDCDRLKLYGVAYDNSDY